MTSQQQEHPLVACGAEEPDLPTIWLPMDATEAWGTIVGVAEDLFKLVIPDAWGAVGRMLSNLGMKKPAEKSCENRQNIFHEMAHFMRTGDSIGGPKEGSSMVVGAHSTHVHRHHC